MEFAGWGSDVERREGIRGGSVAPFGGVPSAGGSEDSVGSAAVGSDAVCIVAKSMASSGALAVPSGGVAMAKVGILLSWHVWGDLDCRGQKGKYAFCAG